MASKPPKPSHDQQLRLIRCEHCRQALKVRSDDDRKTARCPACKLDTSIASPDTRISTVAKSCDGETSITAIGRYQLVRPIGKGGFGEVWEAIDSLLERRVAIKLPMFGSADHRRAARFLTEARAASKLTHPNIVAVYDVGLVQKQHYLAIELVDGKTLGAAVGNTKLPMTVIASIASQLADALDYAHHEKVIHRDIKPGNVILASDGQAKLVDFGLAKIMELDSGQTIDGTILGTPSYMSPEQASGKVKEIGPRSDQYSLGVVLYQLLAGRLPFEGVQAFVLHQIIHTEPTPPSKHRDDVDERLEAICLKALAKAPEDRYRDCGEMREDLLRFVRDEEVAAKPLTASQKAWRLMVRNPKESIAAGVCFLSLTLGSLISLSRMLEAHRQTTEAIQETERVENKILESSSLSEELSAQFSKTESARERAETSLREVQRTQDAAVAVANELEKKIEENDLLNAELLKSISELSTTLERKTSLGEEVETAQSSIEQLKVQVGKVSPETAMKQVEEFLVTQRYGEAKQELGKFPADYRFEKNLLLTLAEQEGAPIPSEIFEIPYDASVAMDRSTATFWVRHKTSLSVYDPETFQVLCSTGVKGSATQFAFRGWAYLPRCKVLFSDEWIHNQFPEMARIHETQFVEHGESPIAYAICEVKVSFAPRTSVWSVFRIDKTGLSRVWDSQTAQVSVSTESGNPCLSFDDPETPFGLKTKTGFLLFSLVDPNLPPVTRLVDRVPMDLQKKSTPARTVLNPRYQRWESISPLFGKSRLEISISGMKKRIPLSQYLSTENGVVDGVVGGRFVAFLCNTKNKTKNGWEQRIVRIILRNSSEESSP